MTVLGIFAGGRGKRLMPLTEKTPKTLLEIVPGRNTMDLILGSLDGTGIEEVFLMTGANSDKVKDRYGRSKDGLVFNYLVEETPMGTLYAFRSLCKASQGDLLLMNGDVVTDLDLRSFVEHSRRSGYIMDMVVRRMRSPYGIVNVSGDRVISFEEKPLLPVLMNAGIYHLKGRFRDYSDLRYEGKNIEETVLSRIAGDGGMGAYRFDGYLASLDGFKDLEDIREHLSKKGPGRGVL